MDTDRALQRINMEAFGQDGLVAALRLGTRLDPEKLKPLRDALELLATNSMDWIMMDRRLACALYILALHLTEEGADDSWTDFENAGPETTEPLTAIMVLIDEIFGVNDYSFNGLAATL